MQQSASQLNHEISSCRKLRKETQAVVDQLTEQQIQNKNELENLRSHTFNLQGKISFVHFMCNIIFKMRIIYDSEKEKLHQLDR